MKVKQLIKITEAINGKLPADMYELDEVDHYSIHRDEPIRIADMDVVYLVRAFRHQERMLRRQVDADIISKLARERDMWKEKALNMVEKETYEAVREALAEVNRQPTVKAEAYDVAWKRIRTLEKRASMWQREYEKATHKKGCNYVFSEIPNDEEGNAFIKNLKQYLNKESYKMRVKGQYLKDEVKEVDGWRPYNFGQPISKSKCLRVYVDINKEGE